MEPPHPVVARIEKEHNYNCPWYKNIKSTQKYPNRIARFLFLKNFPRHFLTKYPNAFSNIFDNSIDVGCPEDLQYKKTPQPNDNFSLNGNSTSNNNNCNNNDTNGNNDRSSNIENIDDENTKSADYITDDLDEGQALNTTLWSQQNNRLYFEVLQILQQYHLTKLVYENSTNRAIRLVTLLESTSIQLRHSFGIIAGWDPKLLMWLHNLITTNSQSHDHLIPAYHEVMQYLSKRLPFLIEKFYSVDTRLSSSIATTPVTSAATTPVHPASGGGGDVIHQRPQRIRQSSVSQQHHQQHAYSNTLSLEDDPAAKFVLDSTMRPAPRRLISNPVILLVPSGPSIPSQPVSARMEYWKTLLSSLGQLINLTISYRPDQNASEVLQVIKSNVKDKIRDIKKKKFNENRPLILVGFSQGSLIAIHSAIENPGQVSSIICLGFPLNSMNGFRGDLDDPMCDMNIPILFVVGQMASTSTLDGLERLRESMAKSDTGLVVVGGANDKLIVNHRKKLYDGITQYHVDRSIADEIYEFVNSINLQHSDNYA